MLSHLFHVAAEWSVGMDDKVFGEKEILCPEEVAVAVEFLSKWLPAQSIPIAQILGMGKEWFPVPMDSYCPQTFDDSVPQELSREIPIVISGDFLFVYGADTEMAFYWKFARIKG